MADANTGHRVPIGFSDDLQRPQHFATIAAMRELLTAPPARLRQTAVQNLLDGGDLPAGVVGELDRSIGDVCEIGEYGGLNWV